MSREWYQLTAFALREAVRNGETSAAEVTQNYLDRIQAVDGKVGAYVEVWDDHAMRQAEKIDAQLKRGEDAGPLAGVPIGLKDVFCTKQGTTTCCSNMLKGYRSPFDATVVERLEAAGGIFLGKLNMDEFAMGASTENSALQLTHNPWNLEHVPGGSSGGSAAAVAASECALALGSDTGGSIRQPAAFCGCVGLKPSYGRVSRYGVVAFASSLDQAGPLTRDLRDMALALNVLCGQDPRDSTTSPASVPDFTKALRDDISDLTIGLPREYFSDALAEDVRARVESAVSVLRGLGAKVIDVSLPHSDYAAAVYFIICTAEASANLARFDGVRYGYRSPNAGDVRDLYVNSKSESLGAEVQRRLLIGTYVLSAGHYDSYYRKALKARTLIRQDFDKAFDQCDLILTPTSPAPAPMLGGKTADPLEMYQSDIYTVSANLAGIPAMSMPCGFAGNGLPVGLQWMGRPFDEETLLRAGYTYEQHRDIDMGVPGIG
ncbi:MAG: Asp-tRNA(Asn)/Glu-tRNA(Gln) amidotransferase subunit GatA [Candidatus Hydrogenedentales bacterium]|jgi:aspartyl-tRNA(Asn)/glutamyl-tRNA(Gln) amidotransferase subunit A